MKYLLNLRRHKKLSPLAGEHMSKLLDYDYEELFEESISLEKEIFPLIFPTLQDKNHPKFKFVDKNGEPSNIKVIAGNSVPLTMAKLLRIDNTIVLAETSKDNHVMKGIYTMAAKKHNDMSDMDDVVLSLYPAPEQEDVNGKTDS